MPRPREHRSPRREGRCPQTGDTAVGRRDAGLQMVLRWGLVCRSPAGLSQATNSGPGAGATSPELGRPQASLKTLRDVGARAHTAGGARSGPEHPCLPRPRSWSRPLRGLPGPGTTVLFSGYAAAQRFQSSRGWSAHLRTTSRMGTPSPGLAACRRTSPPCHTGRRPLRDARILIPRPVTAALPGSRALPVW